MFSWRTLAELEAETEVPIVIVDDSGTIKGVNRDFERVFGWTPAEAVGEPLTIIIPESMREAHAAGFSRFVRTDEPRLLNQTLRLPAVNRSGREFIAEHFIMGEKRQGRSVIGAAMREVVVQLYRP